MGRIRRFLAWPRAERRLLCTSFALTLAIRVSLWTVRYNGTKRWLEGMRREPHHRVGRERVSADRIARLVEIASRFVPGGSHCLTRALATECLLARRGYTAEIRIGVAKDDAGSLTAHAWVEHDGSVLIGGDELARYSTMSPPHPRV